MPNPHSTPHPPPATGAVGHGEIRRVVDSHGLWGDIPARIWLPALEATVQSRPIRLFPAPSPQPPSRLPRTARRTVSSWPGLRARPTKRGPRTCCWAASGTGPTTWNSSTAPHRQGTRSSAAVRDEPLHGGPSATLRYSRDESRRGRPSETLRARLSAPLATTSAGYFYVIGRPRTLSTNRRFLTG